MFTPPFVAYGVTGNSHNAWHYSALLGNAVKRSIIHIDLGWHCSMLRPLCGIPSGIPRTSSERNALHFEEPRSAVEAESKPTRSGVEQASKQSRSRVEEPPKRTRRTFEQSNSE